MQQAGGKHANAERSARGQRRPARCARWRARIGARVVARHDFLEGVRAVIIDKDNAPRWSPATLEGVSETLLDEIFAPLSAGQEWTELPDAK